MLPSSRNVTFGSAALASFVSEKVSGGIPETGQEVFPFEVASRSDDSPVGGREADLDELVVGMNDPGDLGAAGKEVFEPRVDFGPRVGR